MSNEKQASYGNISKSEALQTFDNALLNTDKNEISYEPLYKKISTQIEEVSKSNLKNTPKLGKD